MTDHEKGGQNPPFFLPVPLATDFDYWLFGRLSKTLGFRLATSGNPIGNAANITHILISHFL